VRRTGDELPVTLGKPSSGEVLQGNAVSDSRHQGSMELLADRDPEEARKLLDPVLEHMMEAGSGAPL
jgi:hypothetical protein